MRSLVLGFCLLLLSPPLPAGDQASTADGSALLELPLFPVRVKKGELPLTKALEEVGILVRNGYVLFGVEVRTTAGKEPTVDLDLEPGSTLKSALLQILRQVSGYNYRIAGPHLINIQPKGAEKNALSPLNVRVERFDIVGEQPSGVLSAPELFVPELRRRLAPPGTGPPHPSGSAGPIMRGLGPGVTLHLRDVTVRELLNAVAEATESFPAQYSPLSWACSFEPDPTSPGGEKRSWMWFASVPHNWKAEAGKGPQGP